MVKLGTLVRATCSQPSHLERDLIHSLIKLHWGVQHFLNSIQPKA